MCVKKTKLSRNSTTYSSIAQELPGWYCIISFYVSWTRRNRCSRTHCPNGVAFFFDGLRNSVNSSATIAEHDECFLCEKEERIETKTEKKQMTFLDFEL